VAAHDDGRPSFKLEHLTQANGLAHEAAHDALSDVRATIALARLVKRAPAAAVGLLPEAAQEGRGAGRRSGRWGSGRRPFLHISGHVPAERGCMGLVWPLAQHPTNKNELIVWDLAHDPAELFWRSTPTSCACACSPKPPTCPRA
jgi:exodeoxyribonuclease-1